jgi:predicted nucleotidyltransferase
MSVLGIVAEYNPLHKGHAWHIRKSLEETGAEAAVCVLSSQFVQRGEPALVNKTARTLMALQNGIDLVVELPCAFSCASAEYFASAAVGILHSLGVVTTLSFGSEEGTLEVLSRTADVLIEEPHEYKAALKGFLDEGLSFPAARQRALESYLPPESLDAVASPNNILAIEYLKALKRLKSPIQPITIPRVGQGYNESQIGADFSSATAIRNFLRSTGKNGANYFPDSDELSRNMPGTSLSILASEMNAGRGPVFPDVFESILLYLLRTSPGSSLTALPFMEEGLHNRLKKAAMEEDSLEGVIKSCTTGRYPSSRVKRILCSLLLGMTDVFFGELKDNGYVQYIRVLGFNDKGRGLLARARKKAFLPILVKPSHYKRLENPLARKLFEYEIKATDIYALAYRHPANKKGGQELTTPVVIL